MLRHSGICIGDYERIISEDILGELNENTKCAFKNNGALTLFLLNF